MISSYDVLIVGGGPAGAATGALLARAGVDVLVLDRARFPRPKPCAEYLSPQASRVLDALGVLETIERTGAAQLAGMIVRAPSGVEIVGRYAGCTGHAGYRDRGLSVRREVLDPILLAAARSAGARVEERAHVVDVERDAAGRATGVVVAGDDADGERAEPRRVRARLVIGADGLRSVVSRRLGLARRSRWPERIAFVGHYEGVAGIGEYGEMHVERDGFVGIADVGGGVTTVALVVPATLAQGVGGARAAFLQRWLDARLHLAPRFARAALVSPVLTTGPFASRARRAWAPGAALVGDAADFFDPFTGEGIYSALRGAELLAPRALEALHAPDARHADAALRDYDRARRAEFGGKWAVERIIGLVVGRPALMNRAARVLAAREEMAHLLVGVTGDFVPAREVLNLAYLARLFLLPLPSPLAR